MVAWLLPALSIGASLIGGGLNRRSAESQQASTNALTQKQFNQSRSMARQSEIREVKRNAELTADDRRYAQEMMADDRAYAWDMAQEERDYAQRQLVDARMYNEQTVADDRDYLNSKRQQDIARYTKDRDFMQKRSNTLAERSADSRGIDFTRLRDDAIKAGYNPMTALSMAHAYSTHVDYGVQGAPYAPNANYTTTTPAMGAGGGSGGGGSGAFGTPVMGSHVPAGGGVVAGGGGYSSEFNPALSSGGFIQEAMERGIDSWANQKTPGDPLADALRGAFQQDQMAQQVRDSQVPGSFGYALTEQRPFQPAATIGTSPMSDAGVRSAGPAPSMPSGQFERRGRQYTPVTRPDGKPGRLDSSVARRLDIKPFDTVSPGDWAEIVGEIGEVESVASQPAIRRTVTDDWHIGTRAGDYLKSGTTGNTGFQSLDDYQLPQSRWW